MLPPERTRKKGRPRNDNRKMLNGMLWMNHSGAQWRQLSQCYGPWQSVYARFAKWRDDGLWEKIFAVLSQEADKENLIAIVKNINNNRNQETNASSRVEKHKRVPSR